MWQQIRLHDVVSKYLVHEQSANLVGLNNYLLDAHRPTSGDWADLDEDEWVGVAAVILPVYFHRRIICRRREGSAYQRAGC